MAEPYVRNVRDVRDIRDECDIRPMEDDNNCGQFTGACPGVKECPLGMAYVPFQEWDNIYEPEKGFQTGTIFADLDLPYYARGGGCQ
jgi:hypothetical protein